MNKKVSTLLVATLLAAGPAFTAVYAQNANTPQAIPYVAGQNAINLADGVKFYLSDGSNYLTAGEVKVNNQTFWTLGNSATSLDNAAVFEVRNYSAVAGGATFELYVDGRRLAVSSQNGQAVSNAQQVAYTFYTSMRTTAFTSIQTFRVNAAGQNLSGSPVTAYTTSLEYNAANLKEYNAQSTTFSFDFTEEELVGNEFQNVIPVTSATSGNTYFIRGTETDKFNPDDASTYKSNISILAINPNSRYGLNTPNDTEGYSLYWMNAAKALDDNDQVIADSLSIAGFTSLLEADQLNAEGVIELTMKPTVTRTSGQVFWGNEVKVAGVKSSVSDTRAYVTTILPTGASWYEIKDAQLGDNTYIDASEFLNVNSMNTVAILGINGVPNDGIYYNYITSQAQNGAPLVYRPASKLDFTMAQNQWVVTGFDGKYTVTLQNRLSDQVLTLRLAKSGNGYTVQNAVPQGLEQPTIDNKQVNPVIRLLPITTTQTDGYLTLTDEQIENGIRLAFTGETALAGEQEFFGVLNRAKDAMIPTMSSDRIVKLFPEKNLNTDDEDVITKDMPYAYLTANGEVRTATAEDNLVVPTYTLVYDYDDNGDITATLANAANGSANVDAIYSDVFAFAKNMAGNYSLVGFANTYTDVKDVAAMDVWGVTYNPTATGNNNELEFNKVSRYNSDAVNAGFANVEILSGLDLNPSFPAEPGHYTFDNERGSINMTDIKGINEGALAADGMVFWLDTVDTDEEIPAFLISRGIEGDEATRLYMYNPIDSARTFNTNTASYDYEDVYFYGEDADVNNRNVANGTLKAAFGEAVMTEDGLADAFKFHITLAENSDDQYVLSTITNGLKNEQLYVAQRNGVMILVEEGNDIEPMAFTVNPAEAPTANESVSATEVKVVAYDDAINIKNAAGKNVVISTILGQIVANEVLTSDNATISVPAGIAIVSVDGEEAVKVSVR